MAGKNTATFGLYADRIQVEDGINALVTAGFRQEDISVLFPANEGTKDFAHEKNTKAPEGAATGVGAGGAIGGTLVGMGIPEYEAKRYDGRVRKGGILLSVHCDNSDWVSRAKAILKQTGAEDVSSAGESEADYGKTDKPLPRDVEPRTRTGGGTL
jgi:hypothetical protein